jgi:hypothetical protein
MERAQQTPADGLQSVCGKHPDLPASMKAFAQVKDGLRKVNNDTLQLLEI